MHAPDGDRCFMWAEPVSVSLARGCVGSASRYRSCARVTDTLFVGLHTHRNRGVYEAAAAATRTSLADSYTRQHTTE